MIRIAISKEAHAAIIATIERGRALDALQEAGLTPTLDLGVARARSPAYGALARIFLLLSSPA